MALVAAGQSGLLRLVRLDTGATSWAFKDAPQPSPQPAQPVQSAQQPPQRKQMEFNHEADHGQCVGTLRWSERDSFPALAPWPLAAGVAPPPLRSGATLLIVPRPLLQRLDRRHSRW